MRVTLVEYEDAVRRCVKVPLTQGRFDALVDFAYNAGFQHLRTSTLLRLLNSGEHGGAAGQFERWVFGGGKRLPGLIIRRVAERKLFESVWFTRAQSRLRIHTFLTRMKKGPGGPLLMSLLSF